MLILKKPSSKSYQSVLFIYRSQIGSLPDITIAGIRALTHEYSRGGGARQMLLAPRGNPADARMG